MRAGVMRDKWQCSIGLLPEGHGMEARPFWLPEEISHSECGNVDTINIVLLFLFFLVFLYCHPIPLSRRPAQPHTRRGTCPTSRPRSSSVVSSLVNRCAPRKDNTG